MTKHLEYVRKQADGEIVRFAEMAISQAVAMTENELLVGHGSIVGRVSAKLERYPLRQLAAIEVTPDPTTTELQLWFAGSTSPVNIMFSTTERWRFDRLILALRNWVERLGAQAT
jgi:hypothetical protein